VTLQKCKAQRRERRVCEGKKIMLEYARKGGAVLTLMRDASGVRQTMRATLKGYVRWRFTTGL